MFVPKKYLKIQDDEKTEEELNAYIESLLSKNPGLDSKKLKIIPGYTKNPDHRYNKYDKFPVLKEENFFGFATTPEIARSIELQLVKSLEKLDFLLDYTDTGHDGINKTFQDVYTIYLVVPKSDDDLCPVCKDRYATGAEERMAHINESHFIRFQQLKLIREKCQHHGLTQNLEALNSAFFYWFDEVAEPPSF
jgi:hypothetical protein